MDSLRETLERIHPCDDDSCDVAVATRTGFYYPAAYLLQGATETPELDAMLGKTLRMADVPDFDDWAEWFSANTRECEACGSYTAIDEYNWTECANCLAPFD